MVRIIMLLVAFALLIGPVGAIAHALERDAFATEDVGIAMPVPTKDVGRHCCQSFIHTAKSACHFDAGVVRASTPREMRKAVGVTFETASLAPTSTDLSGLFKPPRPA